MRIVFLGTPDFAVASLEALVNHNFNVVAVVTAPDKPAGRGMHLQQSAVKQYAVLKGIPVLQPEKLKNPAFIEQLKAFKADIQIVVAFRMLPQIVWEMPPLGTINVHGSLLPQYRGAAPINWAIINGEKETGVTTFKLQHAIDTGNILLQEKMAIEPEDTIGTMYNKLKDLGAEALIKTLNQLIDGSLKEQPQQQIIEDLHTLHHAPKIFTETCQIDFNKSVVAIHNLVRGLSPVPGAFTFLQGKKMKIFTATPQLIHHNQAIGSVETDNKTYLKFACIDGYLHCLDIQLEGKKRMLIEDFLR
ncbi:MAG: methionyl-tRNA formyltransferase, partial [Chitinophagaceae bacterium]